jgi:hypothetical protein
MRRTLMPLMAIVAVGAAVITAVSAVAAVPSHPSWESSARFGAWNNGGFIVYNNEWNPTAGPQTIWADSYNHWGVQSNQAARNVAVETYPCVQKDFANVPVSDFRLIRNGFTESMPTGVAGLDAEAADDVWLNDYKLEVMIWVDNHGQRPAGNIVNHATLLGQKFAVWESDSTFTFALNHNETSGQTHILAALQWLIGHGYIPSSVTLTQVDFGWEIASTAGKPLDFAVTSYWLQTPRS